MRAVGYARVSTQTQFDEGASIAAQKRQIALWCREAGADLDILEESASASAESSRPLFDEAVRRVTTGEADVLVVTKLDRLARSLTGFLTTAELIEKSGGKLVVIQDQIDTTTPAGRLMAHMMVAFSQFERELISQRTKEGLAQKRREGVRLGRPPRKVASRTVGAIINRYNDGYSVRELSEDFDLSPHMIKRCLGLI